MAARSNSGAAVAFMLRCRQTPVRRFTSSSQRASSQYAPNNFNKGFTSPIPSPSPVAPPPSNLPTPVAKESRAERAAVPATSNATGNFISLPAWARARARPTVVPPAHSHKTLVSRIRGRLGLSVPEKPAPPEPFNVRTNPYRTHKKWPPTIMELNPKQQFAFEKVHRRRIAYKWARPVFKRWLSVVQNGIIIFIVFYAVFVYDPEDGTPFDGFRAWLWGSVKESEIFPKRVREEAGEKVDSYNKSWTSIKDSFFEIIPVEGLQTTKPVDPEEQKIPWAARKKKGE